MSSCDTTCVRDALLNIGRDISHTASGCNCTLLAMRRLHSKIVLDGTQGQGCGGETVSLERCVPRVRRDDEEGESFICGRRRADFGQGLGELHYRLGAWKRT